MPQYHIWTMGCQMNQADSDRLAAKLEGIGYTPSLSPNEADLVVINSCVVRQSAEDKAANRLNSLKALKRRRPEAVIALMGCMVGPGERQIGELRARFPHVSVFAPPQQEEIILEAVAPLSPHPGMDVACVPGVVPDDRLNIAAYVSVIFGCDEFCTFCIVPYRRGRERSRPIAEVVGEVESLAARGVREVTLLGQIVDSYGHDLPDKPDLADLLEAVNEVDGLDRLRFLTSHPKYMSERLIDAVARLDKVCEFINLPFQAGDDDVLRAMRRPYTADEYRSLAGRIRERLPGAALTTDVIVGFCGETEEQFQRTVDLVEELRFDKVHIAPYSARAGTIASRQLADDVPLEVKEERRSRLEAVQERIAGEINERLVGQTLEVLVEGRKNGKWSGRTRTNKLAFFADLGEWRGKTVPVTIEQASPWALQGRLAPTAQATGRRIITLQVV